MQSQFVKQFLSALPLVFFLVLSASAQQASPLITGITPTSGAQGTSVFATISGANLSGVTSVTFRGTGVTAVVSPNATASQIQIVVNVAQSATPGSLAVTVVTPTGSATLNGAFTVQHSVEPPTLPQPIPEVEQGVTRTGYVIITPLDINTIAPT